MHGTGYLKGVDGFRCVLEQLFLNVRSARPESTQTALHSEHSQPVILHRPKRTADQMESEQQVSFPEQERSSHPAMIHFLIKDG
jgi:hypothetical protein